MSLSGTPPFPQGQPPTAAPGASTVSKVTPTIKQAIEQYERNCASPALREVINFMIERNIKTEFSNDSYLDALTLTEIMFNRSNSSICMLTGAKGDGFLETLKKPFCEALDRIKENKGFVHIVAISPINTCLNELQRRYSGVLKVIPARVTGQIKHYMVCDSKMARMEEIHGNLDETTNADAIHARVCFNDPVQAKILESDFNSLWKRLEAQINTPAAPKATSQVV
jgi:hypothetical protein